MKIGLITFHRSHNYGAVFQCFALKKYLEGRGHAVTIVDYWPDYRKGMYDFIDLRYLTFKIPFKQFLKGNAYSAAYTILNIRGRKQRIKKFNDFIEHELGVSTDNNPFTSESEINNELDCYIFGSDQIWRYFDYPNKKGFDFVYWGCISNLPKSKKITYAASMGKISDFKLIEADISRYLSNFKSISVREDSLAKMISEKASIDTQTVLDPVFLLSKEQWFNFFSDSVGSVKKEKYLLLYNITKSKETERFAIAYARKNNLEIKRVTADSSPFDFGREFIKNPGPIDFIKYIYNADFVVSSSFHGVAFSLIFNKQFISLGIGSNSDRVESLLQILGIHGNYIDSGVADFREFNYIDIDYAIVNSALKRLVERSGLYLEKSLM